MVGKGPSAGLAMADIGEAHSLPAPAAGASRRALVNNISLSGSSSTLSKATWAVLAVCIVCVALVPTAEAVRMVQKHHPGHWYRLRQLNQHLVQERRAAAATAVHASSGCGTQKGCLVSGPKCVKGKALCKQPTPSFYLVKQTGIVKRCTRQPGCLVTNTTCIVGRTVQKCAVPASGYYLGPNGDVKNCISQPNCVSSVKGRCLLDGNQNQYLPCLVPASNFIVKDERVYAVSVCSKAQYIVRDNTQTQDRTCERCSCPKGYTADLSLCTGTTYYNAAKCTPAGSTCSQCTLGQYVNRTGTKCSCTACELPTPPTNSDGTPNYVCPAFSHKSGSQCMGYSYMDTQTCQVCGNGGSTSKYVCPRGFYRDGTACTGNTFGDTQTCSVCSNVQSATDLTYACQSGYYKTGQACTGSTQTDTQTCAACTPIDGCVPPTVTCSSAGDQICGKCFGDYVLSSDGKRCSLKCAAGSYATGSPQYCADCPQGQFCTGVLAQPQPCTARCPNGKWMTAPCDDTQDIQCKVWSTCVAGYKVSTPPTATTDTQCIECLVDKCDHYASGCACDECESGYYAQGGTCHACPEGFFCPGGAAQPAVCSDNCLHCGTSGAGCTVCKPGFYINDGACTACKCFAGKVPVTDLGSNCDGTSDHFFPMDDGSCDTPIENETLKRAIALLLKHSAAEDSDFCWKDYYDRGIGHVPTSCGDWEDVNGLCYQPCQWPYTPEPTCRTICKKEGCPSPAWTSYIYTCTLWQQDTRWQCGGDCPSDIGWWRSTVCTCTLTTVTIGKPTYDRSGAVRWHQCSPGLSWDAGLCYPTCKANYNGVATRCYQDCSLNELHKTDCGVMGCALSSEGCAAAIVDMILAPILFLVNLVVTILTAGLGDAGFESLTASLKNMAGHILQGGAYREVALAAMSDLVRNAITDVFVKATIQKLGEALWEKFTDAAKDYLLHQYINMMLVAGQAKSEDDMNSGLITSLTDLDPTGIASMVTTFTNHPGCMAVNADLADARQKAIDAANSDPKLNKK